MKRIAGLVLFLLAIGAGAWWYAPINRAQSFVKSRLNDPDSAKFSDVRVNRSTGAACGLVNAKNRMGGYVGNTQFILTPSGEVTFGPAESVSSRTEDLLKAAQERLEFVKLAGKHCPMD